MSDYKHILTCPTCSESFGTNRAHAQYCGPACKQKTYRQRHKVPNSDWRKEALATKRVQTHHRHCCQCDRPFTVDGTRTAQMYCSAACKQKAYRKVKPEKFRTGTYRSYVQDAGLPHTLTDAQWKQILVSYAYTCAYCGRGWHEIRHRPLQKDRVIPGMQGGGYTKENVVPACKSCNCAKGGRTPEEAGMVLRKSVAYNAIREEK